MMAVIPSILKVLPVLWMVMFVFSYGYLRELPRLNRTLLSVVWLSTKCTVLVPIITVGANATLWGIAGVLFSHGATPEAFLDTFVTLVVVVGLCWLQMGAVNTSQKKQAARQAAAAA